MLHPSIGKLAVRLGSAAKLRMLLQNATFTLPVRTGIVGPVNDF